MNKVWWKEAVVYQIYPRSFYDSNSDGIGDIQGVIEKLDYIKSLGVDVIWLCPVYDSPQDDNGYDIRDYYNIGAEFGTMADFDRLLQEVHKRGLKLIMDLVVNHTSDEHEWFIASRDPGSDKRDFFIWKDGKEGGPPNNWPSFFGGDAWEYDEQSGQYYLHLFSKKQPDLNWENRSVREEVYKMMNWWLDKGIDGFRMDVISVISKRDYQDAQHENFNDVIQHHYANGPRVSDFIEEMVAETVAHHDVMTVGEGPGITFEASKKYLDTAGKRLNMIFHFGHMFMDHGPGGKFDPVPVDFARFKEVFRQWDQVIAHGGWPAIFLGNHDFPRIVSRFGNAAGYHERSAKLLAMLMLSLRGTVYIYQGEEIGMTNVRFENIEDYRDLETLNAYRELAAQGKQPEEILPAIHAQGRDNARTPMQWNTKGGFTRGTPWIEMNPNYRQINVASQEQDKDSILHFYRKMIQLRKRHPVLIYGDYDWIETDNEHVFAFVRQSDDQKILAVFNLSDQSTLVDIAGYEIELSLLSNVKEPPDALPLNLAPWQGGLFFIS